MIIRDLRKQKKLTQIQLAQLMNVDQTAISQWETGKTRPTIENYVMLSKVFNCELNILIENTSKKVNDGA